MAKARPREIEREAMRMATAIEKTPATIAWTLTGVVTWQRTDTSSQPHDRRDAPRTPERPRSPGREEASTEEAGERSGNPPGDVGEILDDMDEALEENAEEIVRVLCVQQGGQ